MLAGNSEVVPSEFKMKSPCYEIVFHQVRGLEMTSCDFGANPNVRWD